MAETPLEGMIMVCTTIFPKNVVGDSGRPPERGGADCSTYLYIYICVYLQSFFCFSHHEKNKCVSLPRDHHRITSSRWRRCPTWCLHHSSGIQRSKTQGWKATTCLRFDLKASWDCRGQPKHLFYKMEGWQCFYAHFLIKARKRSSLGAR